MQPIDNTPGLAEFIAARKDALFLAPAPQPATFNVYLDAALKRYLPTDQYFGTIYRLQKYFTALSHLREDNERMYFQLCGEAEACKEAGETLANTMVESFAGAAAAFERYKHGDYEQALAINRQSLAIDDHLEEQGFEFFYCHKIQLMHNLAKILDRQHNPDCLMLYQRLLELLACDEDLHFQGFKITQRCLPDYAVVLSRFFTLMCSDMLAHCNRLKARSLSSYQQAITILIHIFRKAGSSSLACKAELLCFAETLALTDAAKSAQDLDNAMAGIQQFLLYESTALLAPKAFLLSHYKQALAVFNQDGVTRLNNILAGIPSVKPFLA